MTGSPSTYKRLAGIALVMILMLSALPLLSQHYTYIGGGMNLNSATSVQQFGPFEVSNVIELDGGSFDVSIRQEINDLISIETGLSHHNYSQLFLINDQYMSLGGFESFRLPVKLELEVPLYKDRIIGYTSFGTHICHAPLWDIGGITTNYKNEGILEMTNEYASGHLIFLMYSAGSGCRFRIVDQLLFEMEFGYTFRTKHLLNHYVTFTDLDENVSDFLYQDKHNFFYLQGAITYPVQRIADGVRWVVEQFEY